MSTLAAAPDVTAEIGRWLSYLGAEKRMSPKTLEAYRRDAGQFLDFLGHHLGGAPSLKQLAKLTPADVRAFMAARRAEGLSSRSLMRVLAGARSFARFLERNGKGKVGALSAVRAPKIGKTLPKPLTVATAKRISDTDLRAGEEREPWIIARDAAVLALLYGSGLRISEALSLKRKDRAARTTPSPSPARATRRAWCRCCRRWRNLIADYVALCPLDLPDDGPVIRRRARRTAVAARRTARHGALARRARPARHGDAARACAIPSPRICSRAAATCAPSRNCSATPRCRPRKFIRRSIPSVYWKFTPAPIRAPN